MTELAQPGGVVRVPVEVAEWVELAEGEWVAPGQAQVLQEIACVQNAEQRLPMKSEHPVILRNAPNAEQRW